MHQEKCRLELTLEQEQECLVNKLMRKIEKLEAETLAKQTNLERLRREKVKNDYTNIFNFIHRYFRLSFHTNLMFKTQLVALYLPKSKF